MYRIFKQPNGKYSVYDLETSTIIYINVTNKTIDKTNKKVQALWNWYGKKGRNSEVTQPLLDYLNFLNKELVAESLGIEQEQFNSFLAKISDSNGEYEYLGNI